MSYTKQQIVNKCLDLEHDNKALWNTTRCLEEQITNLKQEISKLDEEMRQMQKTINRDN